MASGDVLVSCGARKATPRAVTPDRSSPPQHQVSGIVQIKPSDDPILNDRSLTRENQTSAKRFAFVRAEGFLFSLGSVSLTSHFARNAQAFSERMYRTAVVAGLASLRPLAALENHRLATRLMHLPLRGMSRDRLDLLGEEYFDYRIRPKLPSEALKQIQSLQTSGREVVLVSQELDHFIRPLAQHVGIDHLLTNRLEFRDDLATGRLLTPVVPSLGGAARLSPAERGERWNGESVLTYLEPFWKQLRADELIFRAARQPSVPKYAVVRFANHAHKVDKISVRGALAGKNVLIIGTTGFIGKVWLTMLLQDLPELGHIYLLIRRQGARSAVERFEKIVAESPAFRTLHERHGDKLGDWLADRIEVLEGDVSEPDLGLDRATAQRLFDSLDLVVNSAGLTDFNPDLRLALATNVDSVQHLLNFLRQCRHAGLVHVSTCFVNGRTDGRVPEELHANYTPRGGSDFDARREWELLHAEVRRTEQEGESVGRTAAFRAEGLSKLQNSSPEELERNLSNLVRKNRTRWVRDRLIEFGIERAHHWGWPNIYTFTKSLGESLLAGEGGRLPITIARPSIVESSVTQPFRGWNEGVNTTAPLSYLLGTYFRQLPSNKRKRLDVIPVDLVCRGLTLISAAVVLRCHEKVYQLATSATNPANMRRTIELTGLAHRKYYRSLEGLEHWLRARCDTIAVSKTRYRNVSLPRFQRLIGGLQRLISPLTLNADLLARKQRALERVQKVIELYEPFILDNEFFFAADHIKTLAQALPEAEVADFGYDADAIDWYDYWINLHVPALRRWTYPLIEGRRPETGLLPRNFKLPSKREPRAEDRHATDGSSSFSLPAVPQANSAPDVQPTKSLINRAAGESDYRWRSS
jgi:Male sterility protein/haloacid dehalogenase-like hydrolase